MDQTILLNIGGETYYMWGAFMIRSTYVFVDPGEIDNIYLIWIMSVTKWMITETHPNYRERKFAGSGHMTRLTLLSKMWFSFGKSGHESFCSFAYLTEQRNHCVTMDAPFWLISNHKSWFDHLLWFDKDIDGAIKGRRKAVKEHRKGFKSDQRNIDYGDELWKSQDKRMHAKTLVKSKIVKMRINRS